MFLWKTLQKSRPEGEFRAMMEAAGFRNVTGKALTFGLCRMFVGEK